MIDQILSSIPPIAGKAVIELGAGIGRFTGELAKEASHVIAMDFMENSVLKVCSFSSSPAIVAGESNPRTASFPEAVFERLSIRLQSIEWKDGGN